MRVILDTNVLMSAIFFGGAPGRILGAWQNERLELVTSREILEEYLAVAQELSQRYSALELDAILLLIVSHSEVHESPALSKQVCSDPDDDKFLACAIASETKTIVSGDKALRRVSGYQGVEVIGPRQFATDYL